MTLYIDTTDFNRVIFALSADKKIRKQIYKIDPHKSYEILGFLDEFLKANHIKTTSPLIPPLPPSLKLRRAGIRGGKPIAIKKIIVNKGPGSFTGVRIGVVMAQALGFAWNVPVHPVRKSEFAAKLKLL